MELTRRLIAILEVVDELRSLAVEILEVAAGIGHGRDRHYCE